MTDAERVWSNKSDEELSHAARRLSDFPADTERLIRNELRRRGWPAPPLTRDLDMSRPADVAPVTGRNTAQAATTRYDPSVIVTFAEGLYARAATTVFIYTIVGMCLGGAVGAGVGKMLPYDSAVEPIAIVGIVIVGAAALLVGRQKAFSLRLQAQIALCQVQIEANTRNAAR